MNDLPLASIPTPAEAQWERVFELAFKLAQDSKTAALLLESNGLVNSLEEMNAPSGIQKAAEKVRDHLYKKMLDFMGESRE